jgi:hypothetical protein
MAELRAGEEGAEVTVKKISIWFPTEKKSLGIRRVLEKRLLRVKTPGTASAVALPFPVSALLQLRISSGYEQTAAAGGEGARRVARGVARGRVRGRGLEYGKMSSVCGTEVEEVAESDGIEIHLLLRGIAID